MRLYTKAYVEKIDKDQIVAIASTDSEDRQGERIDQSGWVLDSFIKAPRLLWGHKHDKLPVGKVTKIWVEKSAQPKLMFKAEFQTVTKFGKAVKQLFDKGFLNTFSVGFKPIDSEHDEDTKSGVKFTKQELLEISVVNVPANQEALALAYKSLKEDGLENEAPKIFGDTTVHLVKEVEQLKVDLGKVKTDVESAVKGLKFLNPRTGRYRIAKERASYLKMIEKSASSILSERKDDKTARRVKIIKQATDKLIRSNKGEL